MTRKKPDEVNPSLIWPSMPDQWKSRTPGRMYEAAKKSTHRKFWEQADVELLYANCEAHWNYLQNPLDASASMYKEIMARYDALNLSLRGRIMSQLAIESATSEAPPVDSMQRLGDQLKGMAMGLGKKVENAD